MQDRSVQVLQDGSVQLMFVDFAVVNVLGYECWITGDILSIFSSFHTSLVLMWQTWLRAPS